MASAVVDAGAAGGAAGAPWAVPGARRREPAVARARTAVVVQRFGETAAGKAGGRGRTEARRGAWW
ncbi:Uncharacterised protein [Mycobacteroides abscessus]|nr:Uncharacterised protein [Mycobacteroides abscessus]